MKPQITRITQGTTLSSTGQPLTTYNVQFSVGTHGPFTIQIPATEFTAEQVQKRVNDFAATLTAIAPAS